ncbi:MAG: S8 family peptidase [Anaerolineae bacterium]|nr:S8 family peptidase [Anaerolineae bacterium]
MQRKQLWLVVTTLLLALVVAVPAFAVGSGPVAPLLGVDSPSAIAGRYIVVLKPGTTPADVEAAIADAEAAAGRGVLDALADGPRGVLVHYRYSAALNGFAATLPPRAVEALRRNPNVDYIEADQVVSIDTTQSPATWGIDRIDQRNLPLSNSFTYNATGAGVRAYIIDTGIRVTHTEFGGRASIGTDTVGDGQNGNDCNGHGTHVAGTVGGTTYGVAKQVQLIAVRVLNCSGSGSTSGVIAGVDWVTANAVKPAVANMSLGGAASTSLDNAVTNSINSGVTYAIAAGNSNRDACKFSPARVADALTVGATTNTDARASYSNFGSCLDLFAPGSSITSAWHTNDTATNTISGTSMAAPHVAGVAAQYLQTNPTASPATVRNAIVNNATTGVVGNPGRNSPNRLLFTNY